MKGVIENCRSVFATAAVLLAGIFSTAAHAADTAPAGVTLVDLTTATSGSIDSAGTPYSDSRAANKAFDGEVSGDTTRWLTKDVANAWYIYKFNEPTVVTAYTIVNGGSGGGNQDTRAPKTWTFSGSNDKETWTELDSRSNETGWSSGQSRFYNCQSADCQPYTYYKYACTENNGQTLVQIHEMYFYDTRVYTVTAPTLTAVGENTYHLSGTLNSVAEGEVRFVLSAPGVEDVSISLGACDPKATIDVDLDLSSALSSVLYAAKIIVPDGEDGCETTIPGLLYFGDYATQPEEFRFKLPIALESTIATSIGSNSYTDFPILVRLSAAIGGFDYNTLTPALRGHDLLFKDETGSTLNFEVETWNTQGESLVWVKVPTLSASTAITCYYGSDKVAAEALEPEKTWSRYVGVWHFAPSEAGGMTAADATGHGLDGTAGKTFKTYEGPFGGDALRSAGSVKAPDYEKSQNVSSVFTASGWFKGPDFAGTKGSYVSFVSKKVGITTWNADKGWYIQMNQSKTSAGLCLTDETKVTIPDVTKDWNYFTIVSDGSTVKVYYNGSDKASVTKSYMVKTSGTEYVIGAVNFCEDEYRIRKTAATAAETKLEYQTMAKRDFLSFGTIESMDETAPVIAPPTIVRNADGSFTVTTEVTGNAPKAGSAKCVIGSNEYPMTGSGLGTYTATASGLAEGTYLCSIKMTSSAGTECVQAAKRALYAGELAITFGQDANEDGLVAGYFTVTRGDTANDLAVDFTVDESSTAIADQTYVALTSPVVIPDGSASVRIEVTPKMDTETQADTTVKVNLDEGPYGISPTQASAQLTVANLTTPAGWNTWVAPADGRASDAANWSNGVPKEGDKILFDGRFSTANCEWDAGVDGLTAQLGAWKQMDTYTGTVQIDTTYDDAFPALVIDGEVEIHGGKWTHKINKAADGQKYRLRVIVGGTMTVDAGCSITAEKKGYWAQKYPAGKVYGCHAASYDGPSKVYGDVYRPADLGAGSQGSGSDSDNKSGGGAVWLEVAGAMTLNGSINVRGRQFNGANTGCGSVYLKAASCVGSGSIYANYATTDYYHGSRGAGGRVAIVLTTATALELPVANVKINGVCAGSSGGGGGTFYLKTADPTKPNGTLYLDDTRGKSYGARWLGWQAITAIPPGETWTFDEIVISNYGRLLVPEGTTLNLPNGPQSVRASSNRIGGIVVDGGTVNWGARTTYEFSDNWVFQAKRNVVFDGDVIVRSGGALGAMCFFGQSNFSDFAGCTITVNGDLTVEAGGYLHGAGCGPDMSVNRTGYAYHGGQTCTQADGAYDSIFDPVLPGYTICSSGSDQANSCPGGAMLKFVVNGAFVHNGTASVGGITTSNAGSPGGTLNITAKTLTGEGTFNANSASGSDSTGGGGRIAITLTAQAIDEALAAKCSAKGVTTVVSGASKNTSSSAGTVYLQGTNGGTIYVRNDNNALNTNTVTPIPVAAAKAGVAPDAVESFKGKGLVLGDCARVKLNESLKMMSLTLAENTSLDLNGKTLAVKKAVVNGVKIKPGTYTKSSEAVSGYVTGEGTLEVKGIGVVVFVR